MSTMKRTEDEVRKGDELDLYFTLITWIFIQTFFYYFFLSQFLGFCLSYFFSLSFSISYFLSFFLFLFLTKKTRMIAIVLIMAVR